MCRLCSVLYAEVAMSVPDNELIAEVMMFAEGFASAKVLAQKRLGKCIVKSVPALASYGE